MQDRPRSRTAPSTPMAEAPPVEPVELPASPTPERTYRKHGVKHSVDSKLMRHVSANAESLGQHIDRPHSSPTEYHRKLSVPSKPSYSSLDLCGVTYPPANLPIYAKSGNLMTQATPSNSSAFNNSDDTLVNCETEAASNAGRRPSFGLSPACQRASNILSGPTSTQTPSALATPGDFTQRPRNTSVQGGSAQQTDWTNDLISQLAAMRATHEAHIASLKIAHERELASHKTYIALLEKRRSLPMPTPETQNSATQGRQHLTIDTSQSAQKGAGLLSSDASASTSLQSFEMSLENHKRASSEAAAEVESLKRKLELSRKAQADLGDVRRERDQLRDTSEKNDRRITQLKDLVRKTKESEKAARNATDRLEAALSSANNERLDVLEGFHEACTQVRKLRQRERELLKERDDLNMRCGISEANSKRIRYPAREERAQAEHEELERRRNSLCHDPLLQQLDELRQMVAEKAARIQELEAGNQESQPGFEEGPHEQLQQMKQQLAAVQEDRDRYNSLLHSELRRQSRLAREKHQPPAPLIEAEAKTALSKRLRASSVNMTGDTHPAADSEIKKIEGLEKELNRCMQEIILYKLDIKGYKKDVKKANAEVEALKRQSRALSIPAKDHTQDGVAPTEAAAAASSSGLGISLPHLPSTPQRTPAPSTASAVLPAASIPASQPPSTLSSPPQHLKTPLSTNKKLPPKPSSSPDPNTASKQSPPILAVHRQDTLRSLSESIISSYAKRSTPEQTNSTFQTPPPPPPTRRGRSSDPLRMSPFAKDARVHISVPIYSPELMKTSVRSAAAACFT